jgi:hypothetical protein
MLFFAQPLAEYTKAGDAEPFSHPKPGSWKPKPGTAGGTATIGSGRGEAWRGSWAGRWSCLRNLWPPPWLLSKLPRPPLLKPPRPPRGASVATRRLMATQKLVTAGSKVLKIAYPLKTRLRQSQCQAPQSPCHPREFDRLCRRVLPSTPICGQHL